MAAEHFRLPEQQELSSFEAHVRSVFSSQLRTPCPLDGTEQRLLQWFNCGRWALVQAHERFVDFLSRLERRESSKRTRNFAGAQVVLIYLADHQNKKRQPRVSHSVIHIMYRYYMNTWLTTWLKEH